MKNLLIVLLLSIGSAGYTFSQSKIVSYTVPVSIHNEFMQVNRGARDVNWVMHDYVYEVKFSQYGEKKSYVYNQAGEVIEKRILKSNDVLPQAINKHLQDYFPQFFVAHVYNREKGGKKSFLIKLKNGNQKLDLIFDEQGRFLDQKVNWTNNLR